MEHAESFMTRPEKTMTPAPASGRGSWSCVLGGLPVYPRVDVAFFPSQVSSDAVGGQLPFPPFVADGALRYCQDRGDVAGRQQPVRAAEGAGALPVRARLAAYHGSASGGWLRIVQVAARGADARAGGCTCTTGRLVMVAPCPP